MHRMLLATMLGTFVLVGAPLFGTLTLGCIGFKLVSLRPTSYYAGLHQFVSGAKQGVCIWPQHGPRGAGRSGPPADDVAKAVYHGEADDPINRKVLKWVFFQFSGPMQQRSVAPIWLHDIAGDSDVDPRDVGPTEGEPVSRADGGGNGATSCIAQLAEELVVALRVDCDDAAAADTAASELIRSFPELTDRLAQLLRRPAAAASHAEPVEGGGVAVAGPVAPPTPTRPDGRLADNGKLAKMIHDCTSSSFGGSPNLRHFNLPNLRHFLALSLRRFRCSV